ncbi:hypothetical protein Q4577_20680 [Marinovum sp. 2_MG-2023]|uniref:hypothetical protein n=1 Tax=unclassified Marinovum TaxID=2647166 RepID=UPI0026E1E62E|nr:MULTISPECIES: hypothetical protein [unclassified Marinovum]MDO6732450.1 hypothetical protein [Marinovum sp. 2_MG-2023]MDO6781767.1 hypothetical protein [Marinovum sp. 1_MG-2023]
MQHDSISSCDLLRIEPEDRPRGKHTLRIQRFQRWLKDRDVPHVDRFVFLDFAADVATRGVLADLQKSLLRVFPDRGCLRVELHAAVVDHRRRIDGVRMRSEIVRAEWWGPFLPQSRMDKLHIHEVSRLDEWLKYLHERDIRLPKSQDYIEFAEKWASEVPLTALKATFHKLEVPQIPWVAEELDLAISAIRAKRFGSGRKVRSSWRLKKSVSRYALPTEWQNILADVEAGGGEGKPLSSGFLPTVEVALRTLCFCCKDLELPCEINRGTALALVNELKRREATNATIEINISALRRFAAVLGLDGGVIADLRNIERDFFFKKQADIPKKFARLDELGSLEGVLGRAIDLLAASRSERSLELRVAKLNAAATIALFSLIPLRVKDTNLLWGVHVTHTGQRYRLDVRTSKCGTEFHGEICDFVTPFLDALLLRGCDETFLDKKRKVALHSKKVLFAHANGRHMSNRRVANLWQRHIKCGPHIARSVVHTELGRIGREGVEMALSLCAQRDLRTAKFYQGRAMHDALLLEANGLLLSGFSNEIIEKHFPPIDTELKMLF